MSEEFVLTADNPRKLFAPPSRAMKCRQLIWSKAKEADPKPVILIELTRDYPEFPKSEFYHAARALVIHGILTREDINWAEFVRGKERMHYRYAVRYVKPFANASRHW